jgi:hypothetical protein
LQLVAQADDVRLLLKAITGCARCVQWSASRISPVGELQEARTDPTLKDSSAGTTVSLRAPEAPDRSRPGSSSRRMATGQVIKDSAVPILGTERQLPRMRRAQSPAEDILAGQEGSS